MKGLCKIALAALVAAACGGDVGITEPTKPNAQSSGGGILAIGVDTVTGATIETNKDDYVPGEVVHLVGRGWAPNETVNLHMTEEPNTHADVDTNVVADANGGFSLHFYDVQVHDLGVTFTLTATGRTSNSVAVAVFTDGNVGAKTNSPLHTATVSWRRFATSGVCAGTPSTTGSVADVDNTNTTIGSVSAGQSLELTVPATSAGQPFVEWSSGSLDSTSTTICVAGSNGAQNWIANYNLVPTADAGGPYSGNEGSPIALDGSSSTDSEGSITAYNWSSTPVTADAGASCSISPSADPAKPNISCNDDGTYQVRLTVTDIHGATSAQDVATLTVSNVAPTATFGASPASVAMGGAFTISLTGPADAGSNDLGVNLQYSFDCGSGTYTSFAATNSLGCTGTTQPTQTVRGRISDQDGGITEYTLGVTVTTSNVGPTAEANGAYSGFTNTNISLSGAGSTDTDGSITSYAWSYTVTNSPDGGTCSIANSPSNLPNAATISCTQDGTYEVKLTVTDDDGATDDDVSVLTINNKAPIANAGGPYNNKLEGSSVPLNGSGSDSDGSIATYLWTYAVVSSDPNGDCVISNANLATASIVCDDDGSFTVTLRVTDDDGSTNEQTVALNVVNADPVATIHNGPYQGLEGANITLSGSGNDPGDNDDAALQYLWTLNTNSNIDGGGTCTITNATDPSASVKCTDDSNAGSFTVSLRVRDDDGGEHTANVALTVNNDDPTAAIGASSYMGTEGANIAISGSGDDDGDNDVAGLAYLWTVTPTGIDASGSCSVASPGSATTTVSCTDDSNGGSFTLSLKVSDDDGGDHTVTVNLKVNNDAPNVTIGSPTLANNLFSLLSGAVPVSATYTDDGSNDTHQCQFILDGVIDTNGPYFVPSTVGTCSGSILPAEAGVYTLNVNVKDDEGAVGTASVMIVVYDPSAGFVTGGGWIQSEAGWYKRDLNASGKANFGFVSKYKRGATTPEGNTEFQFHAGGLNFHSSTYQWLVVNQAGSTAQFKGTGTINGTGSYTFMLWANDNGTSGDTFRIQITDNNDSDKVVYDNGFNQTIAGGSIVIHTGSKK